MDCIRIMLFGQFRVQREEQTLAGLEARKVQELFSFLLLNPEKSHPREALAGTLWGDSLTAQSRKYLRQALWQLHNALAPLEGASMVPLLILEPGLVRLNPKAVFMLDVDSFQQACARVNGIPGQDFDAPTVEAIRQAIHLYQGDLLEGWYADWCLCERERLQNMYLALLDKMTVYSEVHHEFEAGWDYGARILRYDPASERTHRRLMRLYYLAGDRSAALRQFDRCVAALWENLRVKPSKRTLAVYEQIRADQPNETPAVSAPSQEAYLPDVLHRMKRLHAALDELQKLFYQEMKAIESSLLKRRSADSVSHKEERL